MSQIFWPSTECWAPVFEKSALFKHRTNDSSSRIRGLLRPHAASVIWVVMASGQGAHVNTPAFEVSIMGLVQRHHLSVINTSFQSYTGTPNVLVRARMDA